MPVSKITNQLPQDIIDGLTRRRLLMEIEKVLVGEYEEARNELMELSGDGVPAEQINAALERCICATRRLRKFLRNRLVPGDIVVQLDTSVSDSLVRHLI